MFKQISILLLIGLSSLGVFAQTEKYTAPVKWEKYKVSDKDFSILLPKLPVSIQYAGGGCSESGMNRYVVYAEGIAYGFNIGYKTNEKISKSCTSVQRFNEKNFDAALKEIKASLKTESETKFKLNNSEAIKIKGNLFTYWLINDFKNKRYFELWASSEDENNATIENFFESFKIEKNLSGIEIGKGSDITLGDETTADKSTAASDKDTTNWGKDKAEAIRIILKPSASYTDVARQTQAQGTVMLRITLLESGAIGSIEVLTELPYGLTEQAVAAARKIVFIPAQKNGVKYAVEKKVQYVFTLY